MGKIVQLSNFTKKEGIKVEQSFHRLHFDFTVSGNPYSSSYGPQIRMNHVSAAHGEFPITQKMPLMDLLDADSQGEGSFVMTAILPDFTASPEYNEGGSQVYPPGTKWRVIGTIIINEDGALLLSDGDHVAVEITANVAIVEMNISTIDHLKVSSSYRRVVPQLVQGVTRQLSTNAAYGIIFPPAKIDQIQIEGTQDVNNRKIVYESEVLPAIGRMTNDIVSVDTRTGQLRSGYVDKMFMRLDYVKNVTLVPTDDTTFNVYMFERVTV